MNEFIYLFIYDKRPESATDMPITVNSKLTISWYNWIKCYYHYCGEI